MFISEAWIRRRSCSSRASSADPPQILGILPAGGMRGSSIAIQVTGMNLQGASAICSGKGVRIEAVEPNTAGDRTIVKIAIASDAPLGPHELRIKSNLGASNA